MLTGLQRWHMPINLSLWDFALPITKTMNSWAKGTDDTKEKCMRNLNYDGFWNSEKAQATKNKQTSYEVNKQLKNNMLDKWRA